MNEVRVLMADQRRTMNEERIPRTNEARPSGSIYFQHTPAQAGILHTVYSILETDG